jgi:Phage integrase family
MSMGKRKRDRQPAMWVTATNMSTAASHPFYRRLNRKLGLGDIGWHTFRHTYRSWLDSVGTPIGVQQKLMRHAQIATTMNVYGNWMMESKREANSKVVQMALKQESNGRNRNGHSEQKLARRDHLPLSAPASETSDARNPKKFGCGGWI